MTTTLTAYRVAPQNEHRAARELRRAGCRAYLPTETIGKRKDPVARGYVFTNLHPDTPKPAEAKHVGSLVGRVQRVELIRLYPTRGRGHTKPEPKFEPGDHVQITYTLPLGDTVEMVGKLVKKRGRRQWLAYVDGKQLCVQTTNLIHIDPG